MTRELADLERLDRQTVFHSSTNLKDYAHGDGPATRIIETGKGIRIRDAHGVELIDGFAGLYCVNVGYGRDEIADAIYRQAKKLAYYHTYVGHTNEPVIELSRRVLEWAPEGMSKVYYGLSGSDANETQIKLVRYYNNVLDRPMKKKIISRQRGYHGSSIASGSLTGLAAFHNAFDLPMAGILHTTSPYPYREARDGETERDFASRCAQELEQMILAEGPDTVAAFIGEPVLGTGGIVPPPAGYWEAIQAVLKKYDILLIADEVVCAFGRIGDKFGCHKYGIKPDLITVAKGLTSAYAPLSGVIVGEQVWKVLEQGSDKFGPIGHGYTYSGHALGAAAALANLDILEREDLAGNARDTGGYLQEAMKQAFGDHPIVGDVRGVGMLAALEFAQDPASRKGFNPDLKVGPRIAAACVERGLIARAMPHGDILGFAPPLITTREDVDAIVSRARDAVDAVAKQLKSEAA